MSINIIQMNKSIHNLFFSSKVNTINIDFISFQENQLILKIFINRRTVYEAMQGLNIDFQSR